MIQKIVLIMESFLYSVVIVLLFGFDDLEPISTILDIIILKYLKSVYYLYKIVCDHASSGRFGFNFGKEESLLNYSSIFVIIVCLYLLILSR